MSTFTKTKFHGILYYCIKVAFDAYPCFPTLIMYFKQCKWNNYSVDYILIMHANVKCEICMHMSTYSVGLFTV